MACKQIKIGWQTHLENEKLDTDILDVFIVESRKICPL